MEHPRKPHPRKNLPNREVLFADTAFWVALLRKRDQYGPVALRWKGWLDSQSGAVLTTEAVLWEVLNLLAKKATRHSAVTIYRLCHEELEIEVVPFQKAKIKAAFDLYTSRPDKEWSLTDCFSFLVMKERRLTKALTADHHFQQAGFRALLLAEPPS